jgi:tetratricopeptide (TPR) repeat protein
MKLARLHIAAGEDDDLGEAFYIWVAHIYGNAEAYADAEKLAAAQPTQFEAQYYFGMICSRTGKTETAIAFLRKAQTLGASPEERVRTATSLQRVLSRSERHKEALSVLAEQLKNTDDPELRAKLFVGMANAYAEASPADHRRMLLMYELAIQNMPDDASLRFDAAFKYGEQNSHELGFVHFRRLLHNDLRMQRH